MKIISKNRRAIRLSVERMTHILTNHPEMKEFLSEIPRVVSNPDSVFQGEQEEYIATQHRKTFFLVVVYREEKESGFVITAFKTRSMQYLLKRKLIWKRH